MIRKSLLRPWPPAPWSCSNCIARSRLQTGSTRAISSKTPATDVRKNAVGIQMISKRLHEQLFPKGCSGPRREQEALAKDHLKKWELFGKALDPLPDTATDLPKLTADNILDHFEVLGREQSQWVTDKSREMAECDLPPLPTNWKVGKSAEGWTRYDTRQASCKPERVGAPAGDVLIFDTEVMYKISPYPVMAIAASKDHWYCWIAPGLFSHSDAHPFEPSTMIPIGDPDRKRVIIGHHIAYDRARVLEEYRLRPTQFAFIDTMSMHCAIGGLSSQQRPAWHLYQKMKLDGLDFPMSESVFESGDTIDWEDVSSPNGLKTVADLYLGEKIDKSAREAFATTDVDEILGNFEELLTYCATDVEITHRLFRKLLPKFLEKCPHPASFAGMLHMGKGYLPISRDWDKYCELSEKKYEEYQDDISARLLALAEDALKAGANGHWKDDPWLRNLDWDVKAVRMTKPKIKNGVVIKEARPHRGQKKAGGGKPQWFADLIGTNETEPRITLSKRVAPYLLKLKWNGFPVFWTKKYGWTYGVSKTDPSDVKVAGTACRFSLSKEEEEAAEDNPPFDPLARPDFNYYRVPHPRGEGYNCGSPLSKSYISAFEDGTLTSHYDKAKYILAQNAECAYWKSAKQRVHDQFKYWKAHELGDDVKAANGTDYGVILPQSIVMGTVTRRAVERTWMTAANAKKNRIGSELKSQVQAPAGYKIVGADVDSEELWIASLLGDAQFAIHGATAIGFMTLQGTKKQGTDLHTVTGKILGISRDSAKMFNYARIYGAGVKYAVQLLLQHSPGMAKEQAEAKAGELYGKTKGKKFKLKVDGKTTPIWHGGSETFMFNQLEQIAVSAVPTTPVLRCAIPDSLMPKYVKDKFMTSRVNWAVQSSGVDYLHLLLVSMDYLMRRLKIDGRFMVSIHDEVRYLVKEEQSILAAYCLQIANLWVRAAFSASVGIHDVPASAAFFSSVDIDHCLRKEVDMSCVTPSNQTVLLPGRSVDIYDIEKEILERKQETGQSSLWERELPSIQALRPAKEVNPRSQMATIAAPPEIYKLLLTSDKKEDVRLRIQMSSDESEVQSLQKTLRDLSAVAVKLHKTSKEKLPVKPISASPSPEAARDNPKPKNPDGKKGKKKGRPAKTPASSETVPTSSPTPSITTIAKKEAITNTCEVPWSPTTSSPTPSITATAKEEAVTNTCEVSIAHLPVITPRNQNTAASDRQLMDYNSGV
ncbi:DNA-directed DNA polymerase gamma mip1 [Geranomyces variabilis]|uniref:DNA-directed DNA polymerase n=1 Tax=Geranomyces variabilis TaxID=109894 RepID=A0AAD5TDA5_9FUNG|nr:DNA-directed DNA polymerase gamma mip1 [Geranomyces variabilis]